LRARTLIGGAFGAVALGLAAFVAFTGNGRAYFGQGQTHPLYRIAAVDRGLIQAEVHATGTLRPLVAVPVLSETTGRLRAVLVADNAAVKSGQVLARLDADAVTARLNYALADLAVARANVAVAQAQLERARADADNLRAGDAAAAADVERARASLTDSERDLTRKRGLVKSGDLPSEERDHAQASDDAARAGLTAAEAHATAATAADQSALAAVKAAAAQVDAANAEVAHHEAAVAQVRVDLDHTEIRAPIDGWVIEANALVGQPVAAGQSAPPLFLIASDLRQMRLEASVDEADIGQVAVGQPVTFSVDAFPGRAFAGRIAEIRKSPQVLQNVVTYTAVIAADNPEAKLLPGMTASVDVAVKTAASALRVPNAALQFRPADAGDAAAGGATTGEVWRLDSRGGPQPVVVGLGVSDDAHTEVTGGGLAAGDEIVVGVVSGQKS
jgi:HlyD family secretion protein